MLGKFANINYQHYICKGLLVKICISFFSYFIIEVNLQKLFMWYNSDKRVIYVWVGDCDIKIHPLHFYIRTTIRFY